MVQVDEKQPDDRTVPGSPRNGAPEMHRRRVAPIVSVDWNRIDRFLRSDEDTVEMRLRKVSAFILMITIGLGCLMYIIVRVALGGFASPSGLALILVGIVQALSFCLAMVKTKNVRWGTVYVHTVAATMSIALPIACALVLGVGVVSENGSPSAYILMLGPICPATVAFALRDKRWTIGYSVLLCVMMVAATLWNPRGVDLTGATAALMLTVLNIIVVTIVLAFYIDVAQELYSISAKAQVHVEEAIADARAERRANEAKTRFVSVMSHEIRNPLQAVLLQLDMLSFSKLNKRQRGYLDGMQRACAALLTIVNDILDVTKIDSGAVSLESTRVNLRELVEQTVQTHAPTAFAAGIELVARVDPTIDTCLFGDPTRLRQILHNFVSNALKFTSAGEVEVTVSREAVESDGGPDAKVRWAMSVRDTGIGIDEEGQEKLFREFSQVDESTTRLYGGTGLGLFICKELSLLMGGSVNVQSQAGVGSTFTATLLAPPAPAEDEDAAPVHIEHSQVRWTVVLHAVNETLCLCLEEYSRYFFTGAASVSVEHSQLVRGAETRVATLAGAASATDRLMIIVNYNDASGDLLDLLGELPAATCTVVMLVDHPGRESASMLSATTDEGWRFVVTKPVTLHHFCTVLEDGVTGVTGTQVSSSSQSSSVSTSLTSSTSSTPSSTRTSSRAQLLSSSGRRTSSDGTLTRGCRLPSVEREMASVIAQRQSMAILIVDDFELIRSLVQQLVSQLGFQTLVAANGTEAIEMASAHYDEIGLILMDLEMPLCDGFEATAAIRRNEEDQQVPRGARVPICAMTANASREDKPQAAMRDLSGFLAKPVKRVDLEDHLATHARLPSQRLALVVGAADTDDDAIPHAKTSLPKTKRAKAPRRTRTRAHKGSND